MERRHVGILSLGHLVTDINQGALPAMLPFFIAAYDLSYASAAGIVFAANMASSVVQPLFGHVADRISRPWLLSAGMLLAGWGLSLTGIFRGYAWTLALAVVSGVGIAAYHPEAARRVNFAAGRRKGAAMSLFGVGGTLGFACGPLFVTYALLHWGLPGAMVLALPATIMALVMATRFSALTALENQVQLQKNNPSPDSGGDAWGPFARLTVTVVGRSIIFYGLNTFIPIYWIQRLHASKTAGAVALTVFATAGIAGNLLGGSLADRIGQKRVIVSGFLGLTLLLPLLVWVESVQMATVLLVPIGLMLYTTYSPSIVLGQSYLPHRIGLSSGVTLGVAVAIGGGATPVIGSIADQHGIWFALASVAGLPVITAALALSLPDRQ